jgi:hypothetical protein
MQANHWHAYYMKLFQKFRTCKNVPSYFYSIKIDLKEIGRDWTGFNWLELASARVQWRLF